MSKKMALEGTTYQDIIYEVRMVAAKEMLLASNKQILQISDYLDFENQSSFTRAFKKYYQCTPKAFREKGI